MFFWNVVLSHRCSKICGFIWSTVVVQRTWSKWWLSALLKGISDFSPCQFGYLNQQPTGYWPNAVTTRLSAQSVPIDSESDMTYNTHNWDNSGRQSQRPLLVHWTETSTISQITCETITTKRGGEVMQLPAPLYTHPLQSVEKATSDNRSTPT